MADTDVHRISGLERHGEIRKGTGIAILSEIPSEAIGKWPVDKPEDNTADFIKPILKIKKSTTPVSA